MAFITLPVVEIEIDIPDENFDQTVLRRKAKLITMTYNQREKSLTVGWLVSYYSKGEAGQYGEKIERSGISSFARETVANNSVMVNVMNGDIIHSDEEGNYPGDYTGQYDYFNHLAENYPLKVHELLRYYGTLVTW